MAATLPKNLVVGGKTYTIQPSRHLGDCAGTLVGSVLQYDPTFPDDWIAAVILHEILHAAWPVDQVSDANEEALVGLLERSLFPALFRDNPDLIAWMTQAVTSLET